MRTTTGTSDGTELFVWGSKPSPIQHKIDNGCEQLCVPVDTCGKCINEPRGVTLDKPLIGAACGEDFSILLTSIR